MCLAVPARVTRLDGPTGAGTVDHQGTEVRVSLALLPGIRVGDWVIVHAGFAISRLSAREARETLRLLREMAQEG
jgi:hydrogenase expression/formation protein HypC